MIPYAILIASLGCGQGFSVRQGADSLVVEAAPLSDETIKARSALDAVALDAKLRAEGYTVKIDGGVTVYFGETLWQQKTMDRVLEHYAKFESAIGKDGSFDWSKDPDMLYHFQHVMGSNCTVSADTAAMVELDRTYTFQVGDRSVGVSNTARNPNSWAALDARPAAAADPKAPKTDPSQSLLSMRFADRVAFYAYGSLEGDRAAQAKAYIWALGLLHAHNAAYAKLHAARATSLNDKLGGFAVRDCYGKGLGALPTDVQQQLLGQIGFDYQRLGFASSGEARAWLSQATLASSNGNAILLVSVGARHGVETSVP